MFIELADHSPSAGGGLAIAIRDWTFDPYSV